MISTRLRTALLTFGVAMVLLALFGPALGLGEQGRFVLYRMAAIPRRETAVIGAILCAGGIALSEEAMATSRWLARIITRSALKIVRSAREVARYWIDTAEITANRRLCASSAMRDGIKRRLRQSLPAGRRVARGVLGALAYVAFMIVLVAVSSEIFLRLLLPAPQRYYVFPPNLHEVFDPSDEATPGIYGAGNFVVNSIGLRSDEPWPDRQRTIYVMGGSTAADVYLDQDEAWVHLLQADLNAMPGQPRTWVGNLAKAGMTSISNLLEFKYLVPEIPRADIFINLVGVNDLQLALKSSYQAGDIPLELWMAGTFAQMPSNGGFFDDLATVRFYKRIRDWLGLANLGPVQTHDASGFIAWRKCRQTAPADHLVNALPDLTDALAGYRRNLNQMVDYATSYGAEMVFLTQTSIWSKNMGPAESALLLAGGVGPNNVWCRDQRYFSPTVLTEGLNKFNEVLLSVCQERQLFCIDLASKVAKSHENFYDDMHFSEAGARAAARVVADEIAAHFDQQKIHKYAAPIERQ